jgi:hypothetical protein
MTPDPIFLFPREHGAYGQLAFPLITSLAVAGFSTTALLIVLSVVAGFLAHEPLLVLLGRRGARAKRDRHLAAVVGVIAAGTVALGAGLAAAWLATPLIRWSILLPLIPATMLAVAIVIEHEKRALGEVAAALTFSLVAVPISLASGATLRTAISVGIVFASIFVTSTLAVRVVVLRVRGGGHPRSERATRITVLIVSTALAVGFVIAGRRQAIPWAAAAAAAPGVAGAVWLSMIPPSPTRLRTVGWTLVATAGMAAVMLVLGL